MSSTSIKATLFNENSGENPERSFGILNGERYSLGNVVFHARQLAQRLPESRYAINLCQNRYLFTVAYLAVLFRDQINLLPQNQSPGCLERLSDRYFGSYCITDDPATRYPGIRLGLDEFPRRESAEFPEIDENSIASVSFTSGSTGDPKAIAKTFGQFVQSARLATRRLGLGSGELTLLSTVPPQHMYGLETSVFWPLVSTAAIRSERPFFPEDIRRMLTESARRCILISTPTHLKACAESNLRWSNLAWILSSTASMPLKLAESIEQKLQAPLIEIFGSTETMSFASRRRTQSERWKPYPGIRVRAGHEHLVVEGGHIGQAVRLDDRVSVDSDGRFTLTGRASDLVKVGGKRASLADLNRLINEIDGVRDGVFYVTEHGRLGALVVSRRSKKSLLAELRQSIDEVFLPRPFHRIEKIPRNEMGKIVKLKLDRLIRELDIA